MSATESNASEQITSPGPSTTVKSTSSLRRPASSASIDSAHSSRPRTSMDSTSARQAFGSARNSISDKSSLPATPYDRQHIPGPDDRVFPVRSVVSVDPSQTPFLAPTRLSGEHADSFPGLSGTGASALDISKSVNRKSQRELVSEDTDALPSNSPRSRAELFVVRNDTDTPSKDGAVHGEDSQTSSANDRNRVYRKRTPITSNIDTKQLFFPGSAAASTNSTVRTTGGQSFASTTAGSGDGYLLTARFKHVVTNDGHAVITGRDGNTLQQCEDEPIHIPGAVQGFGLLVALDEECEGKLVVRVVSENSKKIIGYEPHELFALSSFTDILSEEQADNLLDHVDFIRDEDADVAANGPEVFTISLRAPTPTGRKKGLK